ncbi:MAG TPA: dTMP kinase [Gemmatimonadaceae bacterium]
MTERMRGRLIVFEGVEGAGKSTQLQRLAGHLARAGVAHQTFREPGGTPLGDAIRGILLDPGSTITPRAEALLFMASRAQLVAQELRPALDEGTTVLLDRFFLSTYAYQIAGRGLPASDVRSANVMATHGLVPDMTLLLTLPADIGLARAERRSGPDRIERSGREFHARVEEAFAEFATRDWQRAHEECGPIVALDASGAQEAVEALVLDAVTSRFHELRTALRVPA